MAAFIFLCDLSTEQECLDRRLFGTNPGESYDHHYRKIEIGDQLFLYNFEVGVLRGPFRAETACIRNIEPQAWKKTRRSFPWQVRVSDGEPHKAINADDFKRFIPLTVVRIGLLPPPELDDDQLRLLLTALQGTPKA